MVVVDDESVAMMSGGGVDVEPLLSSRNTLGNGKPQTQNLNNQMDEMGMCSGRCGGFAEARWYSGKQMVGGGGWVFFFGSVGSSGFTGCLVVVGRPAGRWMSDVR